MLPGNKTTILVKTFLAVTVVGIIFFCTTLILQSCEKTVGTPAAETTDLQRRRNPPPPPPPVYFYFTNCHNPAITGSFVSGTATSAGITLNYINSPGTGSYPAFTSPTVNGITLRAPAGTLKKGEGSIAFTATGTPVQAGQITIPVSIGGAITCNVFIEVLNPPVSPGNCSDPGITPGSTGCVTFLYRGQPVTYATVRAADGKIWLQQNLGSPQVALHGKDAASFGHYFQWGRWDDGHQVPDGPAVTGSISLQNPSHIASGNPAFIKGSTASGFSGLWWATGGATTDTWSGTMATVTNGKSPCEAIGPGWRVPAATEWRNLMNTEYISDAVSAFESHLKLTESGYRSPSTGIWTPKWVGGYYWSSTAGNNNLATSLFFDDAYNAVIRQSDRGLGINCRCVKN